MHSALSRRRFLQQSVQASVLAGSIGLADHFSSRAIEPLQRQGAPRLLLSLAAYSLRDFFRDSTRGQAGSAPARQLDLFQFIDYCAEHGCQGAELTSYYFPKTVTNEFLLRLKRHAFLRGIAISGTAVGNSFTSPDPGKRQEQIVLVQQWIDYAAVMGAPHIRVFAGAADRTTEAEAQKWAIDGLRECCAYTAQKGVFLGLENHGGIVAEADDLLELVRAVDSPWFGVNLDTGNFHTPDPYGDLAKCAPYAVNVQVKTEIRARGEAKEATDFGRIVRLLREAKYQGYVALEYEAAEDPWQAIPRALTQLRTAMQ